jgi:AhpD family alkylhydroperoxidase
VLLFTLHTVYDIWLMKSGEFRKRFHTPRTFFRDLWNILVSMPAFLDTFHSGRVSRSFAEKIMMAVTRVNGCRYCAYFHARMALREGVSPDEIAKLLALEVGGFPEEEAVALAFAQHWVETAGHPNPEAEGRFCEYYGPQVSADIYNWMRMISFGNLAGNSVDAFLSRLRGAPARGSNPIGEFLLFLLCAPFTLPLLGRIRRAHDTDGSWLP